MIHVCHPHQWRGGGATPGNSKRRVVVELGGTVLIFLWNHQAQFLFSFSERKTRLLLSLKINTINCLLQSNCTSWLSWLLLTSFLISVIKNNMLIAKLFGFQPCLGQGQFTLPRKGKWPNLGQGRNSDNQLSNAIPICSDSTHRTQDQHQPIHKVPVNGSSMIERFFE